MDPIVVVGLESSAQAVRNERRRCALLANDAADKARKGDWIAACRSLEALEHSEPAGQAASLDEGTRTGDEEAIRRHADANNAALAYLSRNKAAPLTDQALWRIFNAASLWCAEMSVNGPNEAGQAKARTAYTATIERELRAQPVDAQTLKNQLCIDGTLNKALDDIMGSMGVIGGPDAVFNILAGLAHDAVDRALSAAGDAKGGRG